MYAGDWKFYPAATTNYTTTSGKYGANNPATAETTTIPTNDWQFRLADSYLGCKITVGDDWIKLAKKRHFGPLLCPAFPAPFGVSGFGGVSAYSMSTFGFLAAPNFFNFSGVGAPNADSDITKLSVTGGWSLSNNSVAWHIMPHSRARASQGTGKQPTPSNVLLVSELSWGNNGADYTTNDMNPRIETGTMIYRPANNVSTGAGISGEAMLWRHGKTKPALYQAGNVTSISYLPKLIADPAIDTTTDIARYVFNRYQ
jgi:hypothetical protein